MVLHICPHPGCPHIRDECPDNTHRPQWTPDQYRGGSTERGYGTEWQRTRRNILRNAQHTCAQCGAHATDVDHIIPRSEGGPNTPDNLRPLCAGCHRRKTAQDAARGRARRGQR